MTVLEKPLSMMRNTRNGFVTLVALMVQYLAANETGQAAGTRFDPLLQLRASIPEISKCRQLIVATTEDWNATRATIQLLERTQGEQTSWQKVGKPFSGVIGSRGLAWGIGLHGTGAAGAPRKMEGDETSPACVRRTRCRTIEPGLGDTSGMTLCPSWRELPCSEMGGLFSNLDGFIDGVFKSLKVRGIMWAPSTLSWLSVKWI